MNWLKETWCWLFHERHWDHKRLSRFCRLCGRSWPLPMDPQLKARFDEVERLRSSWAQEVAGAQARRAKQVDGLRTRLRISTAVLESTVLRKGGTDDGRKN